MTGQHPQTHGLVGYSDGVQWDNPTTLPEALKAAGYQTYLVGRSMHLYPPRKRYGFDDMVQHGWVSDYESWLREHGGADTGGLFGGGVMHNDWTARPWHLPEHLHQTNWTVTEAIRFLDRRDESCPFFLVVSFLAPHPPLQPPDFYMQRYLRQDLPDPNIGDWAKPPEDHGLGDEVSAGNVDLTGDRLQSARAAYYGLINHVDDQLRRLLNPVNGIQRRTGNNTVVLFTSDHGEMLGDHYLWRKQWSYEPSARVPLMISAPKRFGVEQRTVVDAPVCLEDIMPTLLDFAGVDVPDSVDGQSLLPMMRGERPGWRDCLHIEHAPFQQTVTDGREKFVWLPGSGEEQFFDLTEDPDEMHNLIDKAEHADRIDTWRQRLIARLADRPEGFVQDGKLVAGQRYVALLPHGGKPSGEKRPV